MISDFIMLFYFGFTVGTTLLIFGQQYIFGQLVDLLILGMYMHIYLVFGSHKYVLKYLMCWLIGICVYNDVLMTLMHIY
jgi:hypothetical protein